MPLCGVLKPPNTETSSKLESIGSYRIQVLDEHLPHLFFFVLVVHTMGTYSLVCWD